VRISLALVPRPVPPRTVVRSGSALAVIAAAVIWWQPGVTLTVIAFTVLGGALAGVFPALVTLTPARIGERRAQHVIAWQVGAAAAGGAGVSALIGLLIGTTGLAVLGPSLTALAVLVVASELILTRLAPIPAPRSWPPAALDRVPRRLGDVLPPGGGGPPDLAGKLLGHPPRILFDPVVIPALCGFPLHIRVLLSASYGTLCSKSQFTAGLRQPGPVGGVSDLGQVPQHDPGVVASGRMLVITVLGRDRPDLDEQFPVTGGEPPGAVPATGPGLISGCEGKRWPARRIMPVGSTSSGGPGAAAAHGMPVLIGDGQAPGGSGVTGRGAGQVLGQIGVARGGTRDEIRAARAAHDYGADISDKAQRGRKRCTCIAWSDGHPTSGSAEKSTSRISHAVRLGRPDEADESRVTWMTSIPDRDLLHPGSRC
jgi:hypothetical protein